MRRRTKTTVLIVLVFGVLLAIAVFLRVKAPPEAARLLPESDGIAYFNLRPLRAHTHFDRHPVPHDPSYQRFIDATGFEFERDLDEAAFALHVMPNPRGPNGPLAFSEVFIGHLDGKRLKSYFASASVSREDYEGHTIYDIPSQGRTVRVTVLGYDIVAASNTPTAKEIHSIVDRHRTAALPFSGSSLLSRYYSDVPLLSLAWGMGKLNEPLKHGGVDVLGFHLPLPLDTIFVASLRWSGDLRLKVEEIAPNQMAARDSADALNTGVAIVRGAEDNLPAAMTNPDLRDLLNSTEVERTKDRTVITAILPVAMIEKLLSAPEPLHSLP